MEQILPRTVCVLATNAIKIKHILLWKIGIFHRSFLILTVMKEFRSGWNQNQQQTFIVMDQDATMRLEFFINK